MHVDGKPRSPVAILPGEGGGTLLHATLLLLRVEYYVARSFQLAFLNNFAEPLLDFLFAS